MKKLLSFAAVAALATSSFAASDLASAFKEGKTTGQIRAMYLSNDVDSGTDTSAFALGGKLAYESAPLHGISAGAAFYTTNDLGTKDSNGAKVYPYLYGDNSDSYSILGQAYIVGQFGKTTVKVGRQQIDTPLAGSDDIRMVPNLFEAALVINTDLPDTTLIGGYVSRMAGWDSWSPNAMGKFNSMSDSVLGNGIVDDNGVYVAAVVNSSIKDLTLQAWEYYAVDVVNAIYLQADYKMALAKDMGLTLQGQYCNIADIGDTEDALKKSASEVGYSVFGAKASLSTPVGLTPYLAYNSVSDEGRGGMFVFGAWGGYPEFAIGEETWYNSFGTAIGAASPFLNGADVWKVGADYSLAGLGLGNRTLGIGYTSFDMTEKYGAADTTALDVVYTCSGELVKNLDAKIAYTMVDSDANSADSSVFKVIFNYNF